MNFKQYQKEAEKTAVYPDIRIWNDEFNMEPADYLYPILGLMGETGEVCEKIKKHVRDNGGKLSRIPKEELTKELGDVLWYIAMLCTELDISMNDVAELNIKKLKDRLARTKLHGEGDNR